jgi:hypothetical protein
MAKRTGKRVAALKSIEAATARRNKDAVVGTWAAAARATLQKTAAWYSVELVSARHESMEKGLKQSLNKADVRMEAPCRER